MKELKWFEEDGGLAKIENMKLQSLTPTCKSSSNVLRKKEKNDG